MLKRSLCLGIELTALSLFPLIAALGSEDPDFELEAGNDLYLHPRRSLRRKSGWLALTTQ